MLSEVLKNQPIKDKRSSRSPYRSFSLSHSPSHSFSTSPLLDSAEIIDRVHYARAMHRYLHTLALQRAVPYLFLVS